MEFSSSEVEALTKVSQVSEGKCLGGGSQREEVDRSKYVRGRERMETKVLDTERRWKKATSLCDGKINSE